MSIKLFLGEVSMFKYFFLVSLFVFQSVWAGSAFQQESLQHNTPARHTASVASTGEEEAVEQNRAYGIFDNQVSFSSQEDNYFMTSFQKTYRMGVGFDMMGKVGLAGVSLQLVLNPEVSVLGGFGLAGGFNAAFVEMRQVLRQYKRVLAYWGVGLAQWSSESGAVGKTFNPGFLRGKFLKPGEIKTGSFRHFLISGSLGFKYLQTTGDLKGSSFYMELSPLFDLSSQSVAPSAGFGVAYYF